MPHLAAGQRFPQHDPHRVDVAPTVDTLCGDLLWRHVAQLALDHPGRGLGVATRQLCDTEIEQLDLTVERDEYVVRADVAVYHAERSAIVVLELVRIVQAAQRVEI